MEALNSLYPSYYTISKDNEIFKSEEYQKDKYLFMILEKKINHENAKIMSDGKNYVIVNESEERWPWIWTKDNFDKSKLVEIEELIEKYLVKDKMTFTCKKQLYNALLDDKFDLIDKSDYFELGFMKCEKLKETKPNDGIFDRARPDERELIADYILAFNYFMDKSVFNPENYKSKEDYRQECLIQADEEINSDKFFVLRNPQGKIVCMAHYTINNDWTAKVGLVYTPEEERWKSYAAKLVHEITGIILSKWYVPVLYTDQKYPNSNKAYANAGYENGGTLINFSCKK